MNKKPSLLILYDWFYPGFRAGGPIQSLTNLAVALLSEFEIHVLTGSADLNSASQYDGVVLNSWNAVSLPGSDQFINVFYCKEETLNRSFIVSVLSELHPDIVYLNGIFSYRFFLLPLLALKKIKKDVRIVICPRGMLKQGALEGKSLKKGIYITLIRWSRWLNKAIWHATTAEEASDIVRHFPANWGVVVAPNIPKSPVRTLAPIAKKKGALKLVYLSLINPHKNLYLLLQLLKDLDYPEVSLDIYGPIVDETYWSQCDALIKQMRGNVHYRGTIEPPNVQQVLSQYHSAVLLTKGENFGHALYESFSVGRPVITSHFTPWQNLRELKAGVNVDISDRHDAVGKIKVLADLDQEEYELYCKGAYSLANTYYSTLEIKEKYRRLFLAAV